MFLFIVYEPKYRLEWYHKKEARGSNDEDLGEVQEVTDGYVLVQRGMINKEKFYIPQDQVESYDGSILRFRITEDDLNKYAGDEAPASIEEQYASTTELIVAGVVQEE